MKGRIDGRDLLKWTVADRTQDQYVLWFHVFVSQCKGIVILTTLPQPVLALAHVLSNAFAQNICQVNVSYGVHPQTMTHR